MLAGIGLAFYFYSHINDKIRDTVQAKWQAHYPGLVVSVGSAQLVDGEGIEIRGLSISDPAASGPQAELAYFDEIVCFCQTSLPELMKGEPEFSRILVRRPIVHATRRPDGSWSASQLIPPPKFSEHPHEVTIENGTLEIFDPLKNPPGTLTLRDINLVLKPVPSDLPTDDWATDFRGYLTADHVQRVEVAGHYGPHFSAWEIHAAVAGLDVSPELAESLPAELADRMRPAAALRGLARVDFHAAQNPKSTRGFDFGLSGQLAGARFDDPRLPYPITDMQVDFQADQDGARVDSLTARCGQASLKLTGRIQGLQFPGPLSLEGKVENLVLGRQWEAALTPALLDTWHKFQPSGDVDADFKLSFDGRAWHPQVTVHCVNAAFSYYKLPYPLDRGAGTLMLDGNQLSANLTAMAGGRPLTIVGRFQNPGPQFTGDLQVSGENLPFDQNLLAALSEKPRAVLTALNLMGTFNLNMRVHREQAAQPPSISLAVALNGVSVRYEKFPYPIHNVRGSAVMSDNFWTFRDLEGSNGSARIHLQGFSKPVTDGWEMGLQITGNNVALQDELRDALQSGAQRVWNQLRPQGAINLTADVHYLSATRKPEVVVRAEPVGDSASIEPVTCPCRLEKIHGRFAYHDGRIDLEAIRAAHDRTPLETSGFCEFDKAGNWHLRLERLAVDHLRVDRELLLALSGRMKKCLETVNPTGAVNVAGTIDFSGTADPNVPLKSAWNLAVDIHQGSLDSGVRVENINGGVRLIGECVDGQVHSRGLLGIDSLTIKDLQFTQVQGPIWIDQQQVILGSAAEPTTAPDQPPHRITARFYGGFLQSDLRVQLGDVPRYTVQALLTDGDLKRFAQETLVGRQKLDGKVWASLDAVGAGRGVHSLLGRGQIRLTQADIYELPLMVALLKLLSVKPPDATAFTNSSIDYRIEGDHIYLDKIALEGDAVSLEGSGEIGFDSAVKLTLHSLVGRSDWQIPVFKNVMGAASRQLMQIHVTGTLADPKMTREVLPAVNKALEQVQSGVQAADRSIAYPQTGGVPPGVGGMPAR